MNMILTGERLFDFWVRAGLCSDQEYRWPQLSENRQKAWNALALVLRDDWKANDRPNP